MGAFPRTKQGKEDAVSYRDKLKKKNKDLQLTIQ